MASHRTMHASKRAHARASACVCTRAPAHTCTHIHVYSNFASLPGEARTGSRPARDSHSATGAASLDCAVAPSHPHAPMRSDFLRMMEGGGERSQGSARVVWIVAGRRREE
eukprot:3586788-Pleurochrysis_carterae.AAC.1